MGNTMRAFIGILVTGVGLVASVAIAQEGGLKIRYGYGGKFGPYGIADTATAYVGDRVVAEAKALEIIKKEPGPNHIKVEEVHFSRSGQEIYRGTIIFQFGFGGGTIVEEKSISGKKTENFFGGWPAGH